MIVMVRDTREPGGITERRGAECGVPGLAVAGIDDYWTLVHVRSGTGVARFGSPEAALRGAQAVAGLADWTRPGAALSADEALRSAVMDTLGPLGAWWFRRASGPEMADLKGGG